MDQEKTPPPPMSDSLLKDDDDDDLFASALQSTSRLTLSTAPVDSNVEAPSTINAEPSSSSEPVEDEIDLNNDDEPANISVRTQEEVPSPSPFVGATASTSAIGQITTGMTSTSSSQSSSAVLPTASNEAKASPTVLATSNSPSQSSDTFIEISVEEPKKQGEGYGSFVVYKVSTRTNLPYFRRPKSTVYRRFSDFRGLRDKLAVKHLTLGRIVPPAPKKDAVGTAKVKMSKDELGQDEFIEKRRLALERFLNRTASHETLRADPDFREFLELETELPRSVDSSALSGAGVRRFLSKFGDQVNNWTFRMEESDSWFEEKTNQIESLDSQLRKLQQSIDALIHHRRELCSATGAFAKASAMLGNYEEHTSLSCALVQLSETHDKVEQVYSEQYNSDFLYLSELIRDYINLIGAIKEALHQRVKVYQNWQHAQQQLIKKKEMKARSELAGRSDKAAQAVDEFNEWKGKVERGQHEFEEISTNIREELGKFEITRIQEFKSNIIKYMESLLASQQQLIKHWEAFLPSAKGIST